MTRFFAPLVAALFVVFALAGCSSGSSAAEACTDPILANLGAEAFADVVITETIETPGGAIDIRGSFAGGTFACGLTSPATLEQALVYMNDGTIVTVEL